MALMAVLVVGLTTGCVDREAQKQGEQTQKVVSDPSIAVTTEPAKSMDVPAVLGLTGALKTSGDVQVSAKASGRIEAVYVKEGDQVRAGELIARLEGMEAQSRLSQAQASAAASKSQLDSAMTDAKSAPLKSAAAVRGAESRLAVAKDQLQRWQSGSHPAELQQAKNNLNRAKSDLDYAQKQLERTQRLFDQGAIALTDLEAAQNRKDNAATAYENAKEQLRLAQVPARTEDIAMAKQAIQQAEEDVKTAKANKQLDPQFQQRIDVARANYRSALDQVRLAMQSVTDLRILAPTSGRVTGSPLQRGTVVSPGLAIARVVNLEGVYYDAEVGEADVAKVHEGQPVSIKIDALPDVSLNGHIRSVETIASSVGRLFSVRVDFDQKPGVLKAGMFAHGEVVLGVDHNAVTVPSNALVTEGDKVYVYTVPSNNKAKKVAVTVTGTANGASAVRGIGSGDMVVIRGQNLLVDGALVKPQEAAKAGA
ncbi:MAG: efflux RND transporter periplasmic adaptor subunit [Armatimonadota bacterium]